MCIAVILFRPESAWPFIFALNREEKYSRLWRYPGCHWKHRLSITAGYDELSGGTWLGVNSRGVMAATLNRELKNAGSLNLNTRGYLAIEALKCSSADEAVDKLSKLQVSNYSPFNMVIADKKNAYWLRNNADGLANLQHADVFQVPVGLSLISKGDINDESLPRIKENIYLFRNSKVPDPSREDWNSWKELLAKRSYCTRKEHEKGMALISKEWGTTSSSLIAIPHSKLSDEKTVWLFSAGFPTVNAYRRVCI